AEEPARHLPPFDFAFVQAGDALIPARRGAIPSPHAMWEFLLEPGRAWDEPGDDGYTRAALPFTLEEKNANCMHNGVLTFLFRNDGSVSDVAYQMASETCLYFKFDLWGRAAARYVPGAVPDAAAIAAAYAREVATRLPVKPIAALAQDHPGIDPADFGAAAEIDPADMTTYGLVLDGVNYRGGCQTRLGPYPFCEAMDLPSYSLAKSLFAGLGTMRLSRLYPGVAGETVAPLVPECAAAGTWQDVTLGNLLDMASGHFNSSADQADEDAADIAPFFEASDHAGRIRFACTQYPRKAAPGTQWVYHTADTYLLGTALNAFYRGNAGAGADVYRDVLTPLWRQLDLSPAIDVTRRSYDAQAQPFAGWGLTLHADDVAKLAAFITSPTPLLDRKMLDAALQRDPADPGMRASNDAFRYHNGFWAWNAAATLGCKSPAWIPFLSGYGGIAVALMPNGVTYYYFSDGGTFSWARAAMQADRIKSFCEK
ncbi:MAG TPA: serine hydrolase, partial [Rhizomicrobium sp.]